MGVRDAAEWILLTWLHARPAHYTLLPRDRKSTYLGVTGKPLTSATLPRLDRLCGPQGRSAQERPCPAHRLPSGVAYLSGQPVERVSPVEPRWDQ